MLALRHAVIKRFVNAVLAALKWAGLSTDDFFVTFLYYSNSTHHWLCSHIVELQSAHVQAGHWAAVFSWAKILHLAVFSSTDNFDALVFSQHSAKVQTVVLVTLDGYGPERHQCLLLLLLLLRIRCNSSIKCFTNVVFTYLRTVYFYYLLFILWWSQLLTLHTVEPATHRPTLMANVKGHHVGQSC